LQGDQFGYCPPWALAWPYRKLNLLKELLAYDADIMCLQEVQSNHFQVRSRHFLLGLFGAGGILHNADIHVPAGGAVQPLPTGALWVDRSLLPC